jgi:electron transfer flavoprotein alpha subunit
MGISSTKPDSAFQGLPENYAPLLVENIKKGGYTHVVAGHTAFGKNLMPRVSALLDTQQISDITDIESEDSMFAWDQNSWTCTNDV